MESDQQYRGFRWWNKGGGSRTTNNHFTRDVLLADGTKAYVGYGVDSLTVGLVAIRRVKFAGEAREAVASVYLTAKEAPSPPPSWALLHSAQFRPRAPPSKTYAFVGPRRITSIAARHFWWAKQEED